MSRQIDSPLVRKIVSLALEEDLALGDITSTLVLPENARATARLIAKEDLIVCGTELIGLIFEERGAKVEVQVLRSDGSLAKKGDELARMSGATYDLLTAERTMLNFLQRLSGVATFTRQFVEVAQGRKGEASITVLDTRKTTPGLRVLEKYATRIGGAKNHRMNLGDMVLVKNNHFDAAPGASIREKIGFVMQKVKEGKPQFVACEVEVRSIEELEAVLSHAPQIVMLDNMSDGDIKNALALIAARAPEVQVEISGGITPERMSSLRTLGVRCVSAGALTTQAVNVDISLRITPV